MAHDDLRKFLNLLEENGQLVRIRDPVMPGPHVYPRFSILDPEATLSLPKHQIANGIVDAFAHVLEQYMTYPVNSPLQDRMAEGILLTLIREGPKTPADPEPGGQGSGRGHEVGWKCVLQKCTLNSFGRAGAFFGADHPRLCGPAGEAGREPHSRIRNCLEGENDRRQCWWYAQAIQGS